MRHTLPVLPVLLAASGLNAQSWCPPGATWTHHSEMFTAGFQRMTYTGDTLIAGDTAQVIDRYQVIQYPQPGPPYWSEPYETYQPVAMITRTADDVVYTWSSWENAWDTLYWFGANIGDHWYTGHITDTTCAPFVVADTGTVIVDGVPLRWLDLEHGVRVYERIGALWPLFCPNWIIDGPMGLRCYSDDELAVNFTSYGCTTMVGMEENIPVGGIQLFPNPGTDHFTLHLPPGPHTIEVFGATGRRVLHQRTTEDRPMIGTQHLPTGMYHVRVTDRSGNSTGQRWVRQ